MKKLIVVSFALVVFVTGCNVKDDEQKVPVAAGFEIPRSLVTRMLDAHDRARNRTAGRGTDFDSAEMISLANGPKLLNGLELTNALEIASRPRGEMKFCDDGLPDSERHDLWPFEIEKFEAELESKMEVSAEYGYQMKPQFEKLAGSVGRGGFGQGNQTLQWVNREVEQWAVKELDKEFGRVEAAEFCATFRFEEMPEGVSAWQVGAELYLIIRRGEEAWEPREYEFVRCKEGRAPHHVATFDSFPGAMAVAAVFRCNHDVAGGHNVAAMIWNHQCDRVQMSPYRIYDLLLDASCGGIVTAKENLEVMRKHMPEVVCLDEVMLREASRLSDVEAKQVRILRTGVVGSSNASTDSPNGVFCPGLGFAKDVLWEEPDDDVRNDSRGELLVDLFNMTTNRAVRLVTFTLRKKLMRVIKESRRMQPVREDEEVVCSRVFIRPGGAFKARVEFKPQVVDDKSKYAVDFKLEIKEVYGCESSEDEWCPKNSLRVKSGSFRDPKPGDVVTLVFTNDVEMAFCWCPATTSPEWMLISGGKDYFMMGCPTNELGAVGDETLHPVMLTRGFWIAQTPMTERQFLAAGGKLSSPWPSPGELPVQASWSDCRDCCANLSSMVRKLHLSVAMPTEAEWEYACRAGTTTALNSGKDLTSEFNRCKNMDEVGWYARWPGDSMNRPCGVKRFKPNAWNAYDMHGNVFEWCFDDYGWLPGTLMVDPTGPERGYVHVARGGDSTSNPCNCRSASRCRIFKDEAGIRPIMRYFERYEDLLGRECVKRADGRRGH